MMAFHLIMGVNYGTPSMPESLTYVGQKTATVLVLFYCWWEGFTFGSLAQQSMATSPLHPYLAYGCTDGSFLLTNLSNANSKALRRHYQPVYHVSLEKKSREEKDATLYMDEAPPVTSVMRLGKLHFRTDPGCVPVALAWSPFPETSTWLATSIQHGIVRLEDVAGEHFQKRLPNYSDHPTRPITRQQVHLHTAPFSAPQLTIARRNLAPPAAEPVASVSAPAVEKPPVVSTMEKPKTIGKRGRPKKYASFPGECDPVTGLPLPPKPVYDYGDRYKKKRAKTG